MKARPFEDGRWSALSGVAIIYMEDSIPVRIRYLANADEELTRVQAGKKLADIFGARFCIGPRMRMGEWFEAPLEM